MKIVIIPSDNTVYKDKVSYSGLNLQSCQIPVNIHALQFNDVSNKGWLEFVENDDGAKLPNEPISQLPAWAINACILWDNAKVAESALSDSNTPLPAENS